MGFLIAPLIEAIEDSFYGLGWLTLRACGVRQPSDTYCGVVGVIVALALIGGLVLYYSL